MRLTMQLEAADANWRTVQKGEAAPLTAWAEYPQWTSRGRMQLRCVANPHAKGKMWGTCRMQARRLQMLPPLILESPWAKVASAVRQAVWVAA